MFKSIIYIVVVNQEWLISAVPHLYYHRRLIYRLYFTVSAFGGSGRAKRKEALIRRLMMYFEKFRGLV